METITIKDIARICGVGVSTVSRAMNDHPDINAETKQKVMDIISTRLGTPTAGVLSRHLEKAIEGSKKDTQWSGCPLAPE